MERYLPDNDYPPDSTLDSNAIESVLHSVANDSYAVAVMPSTPTLEQIIETLFDATQQWGVSILGTGSYLSTTITGQAYVACAVAELNNRDMVRCYQTSGIFSGRHLYSQTEVATAVEPEATIHVTGDTETAGELLSSAASHITDVNAWSPDILRLGRLKKTVASHLGEDAASELVPLLRRVPVSGRKTEIELLNTVLLLAARHTQLFKHVAEWGIETGIASRSAFTRRRDTLATAGLLTTQKVRKGIGAARIQLSPQYPLTTDSPLLDYFATAQEMLNRATGED